jgi:hypothetical protein
MSTFFNHKNSYLLGTAAGAAAYSVTLYTSPAVIYAANFIVGSALISLLGPVAAAAMGWALPFLAVLAMGGLAGWLMSSLINMFNAEKQVELVNQQVIDNHQHNNQEPEKHNDQEAQPMIDPEQIIIAGNVVKEEQRSRTNSFN